MANCGICLDVLRSPVSIPCGHVHCERCLRAHINSGADALRSTCPTCRKPFHIATPDFSFVPQKYHDFILPSVRRVYMDIPSVAKMTGEIDILTRRLEAVTKENEHLRQRCADYKYTLENLASEKHTIQAQEEELQEVREGATELRKKYDALKKRYQEVQSRDHECNWTPPSPQTLRRRSSRNLGAYRSLDFHCGISPKVEELPVSLQEVNTRPKRALPKSRLSNGVRRGDDQASQLVKRQRTHRHSDVGSSNQLSGVGFKSEDEDE